MRVIPVVFLLAALAAPEDADPGRLVDLLGHRDAARRGEAARQLGMLGKAAWAALQRALEHGDPEVAGKARKLLRGAGWVDPKHDAVITRRQLSLLRGPVSAQRRATAADVARGGVRAREALRDIYGGGAGRFLLEIEKPGPMRFAGPATLTYRVRNAGRRPGWVVPPQVVVRETVHEPFGRRVRFPVRARPVGPKLRRQRLRAGRWRIAVVQRGGAYLNTADQAEWVEPGALASFRVRAGLALNRPGMYRVVPQIQPGDRSVTIHIRESGDDVVPKTVFQLPPLAAPATRPLQFSVLPDPLLWGRENSGLSLEVAPTVEGLRVSLVGLSDARVPRDLSSGWFVALDDHNRVLAHGSLEGGGPEERTYRDEDLVRASGLEAIVPYPRVPKAATGLLLAVRLDDGRSLHGRTVLSRRIRLSDTMAR